MRIIPIILYFLLLNAASLYPSGREQTDIKLNQLVFDARNEENAIKKIKMAAEFMETEKTAINRNGPDYYRVRMMLTGSDKGKYEDVIKFYKKATGHEKTTACLYLILNPALYGRPDISLEYIVELKKLAPDSFRNYVYEQDEKKISRAAGLLKEHSPFTGKDEKLWNDGKLALETVTLSWNEREVAYDYRYSVSLFETLVTKYPKSRFADNAEMEIFKMNELGMHEGGEVNINSCVPKMTGFIDKYPDSELVPEAKAIIAGHLMSYVDQHRDDMLDANKVNEYLSAARDNCRAAINAGYSKTGYTDMATMLKEITGSLKENESAYLKYLDWIKAGNKKEYYETGYYIGRIKREGNADGSRYREFYESGGLSAEKNTDSFMEYFEDGSIKTERAVTGLGIEYFKGYEQSAGTLAAEGAFKDGKKDGPWKKYYYDGTLKEIRPFIGGKEDGICKKYRYIKKDESKLREEVLFKMTRPVEITIYGLEDYEPARTVVGIERSWLTDSGDEEFEYEGKYEEFYPDGSLRCEGIYRQGKKQGEFIYYNGKSGISRKEMFENGEKTRERTYVYYDNGSVGIHVKGEGSLVYEFFDTGGLKADKFEVDRNSGSYLWIWTYPDGRKYTEKKVNENLVERKWYNKDGSEAADNWVKEQ